MRSPDPRAPGALRHGLLILGVAAAVALVSLAVQYPVLGASRNGFSRVGDEFGYAVDPAQAFARVLLAVTVFAWVVGERVLAAAPMGARRGRRLGVPFGVAAAVLTGWSILSYCNNAQLWSPPSWGYLTFPWPGPLVPVYFTESATDPGAWSGHPDLGLLLGPGLLLVALAAGLWGARWTAARFRAPRAGARAYATALGVVAALVAAGIAGIVACQLAVTSDDLPAAAAWLDPQLLGALVAIPVAFAASGGQRGRLALLLVAVVALGWNPVVLWAAGESDAYLGLTALALVVPLVAASLRPMANAFDLALALRAGGTVVRTP